jgi:hypothetical protein
MRLQTDPAAPGFIGRSRTWCRAQSDTVAGQNAGSSTLKVVPRPGQGTIEIATTLLHRLVQTVAYAT